MMKSILLLPAIIGVAFGLQVPARKGIDFLCEPCVWCFKEVEKDLPEIDQLTEDILIDIVAAVCKRVPFIEHVCDQLGDDIVRDLYQFILTLDHYDAHAVCVHLDMCKK